MRLIDIRLTGSQFPVEQISLGLTSIRSLAMAAALIYLIVRNLLDVVGHLEIFGFFVAVEDACQTLAFLAVCFLVWHI